MLTLKVKYSKKLKNFYVKLPSKLLKELSWNTGDNIEWIDNKDGSFTLKKV